MLQIFWRLVGIYYVTHTFDPVTLNNCSVSAVLWSNSVPDFSEIEQSATVLYNIKIENLATVPTMDFMIGGFQSLLSFTGPIAHTHVTNFSQIRLSAAELY